MSADFESALTIAGILPASRAKARGIPMPAKAGAPLAAIPRFAARDANAKQQSP
jgi:hypothetical protein